MKIFNDFWWRWFLKTIITIFKCRCVCDVRILFSQFKFIVFYQNEIEFFVNFAIFYISNRWFAIVWFVSQFWHFRVVFRNQQFFYRRDFCFKNFVNERNCDFVEFACEWIYEILMIRLWWLIQLIKLIQLNFDDRRNYRNYVFQQLILQNSNSNRSNLQYLQSYIDYLKNFDLFDQSENWNQKYCNFHFFFRFQI